jgi:hypothetical protein
VRSTVQEVRAQASESDALQLQMDVLLTDGEGESIPCGEAVVDVEVEISRNGEEGPWVGIESGTVLAECTEGGAGHLALVIDNSGSVVDQLPTLKEGAARVMDRVVGDGGQVSLVRVSTDASVRQLLTSDRGELGGAIDELFITNGWTALWDGVRIGNETLALAPDHELRESEDALTLCTTTKKQGIVLFTDGQENNSSHQKLQNERYPGDGLDTTLDDLLLLHSQGTRTPIYPIGLGPNIDRHALTELAEASGGRFFELDSMDRVSDALQAVSEYFGAAHRVCSDVPSHFCGPLDVRVTHRFSARGQTEMRAPTVEWQPCCSPSTRAKPVKTS